MEVDCHLPPLLFSTASYCFGHGGEGVHPFAMDKKLYGAARAWTLYPQAALCSVHPVTLGYESSSAGLGWFVHEGTWWLGHGGEYKAPSNGKADANL